MRKTFQKKCAYNLVSISVLLLCCHLCSFAQNGPLKALEQSFTSYQQKNLTEKLYVHTDKGFYLAGEILWFKVYSVDGTYHHPLSISKVAYVEVIDANMNPVIQQKIEMKSGSGSGSFYLPVTLSSGNFQLRVYTNWMKNASPDFYFHKVIPIVNTLNDINGIIGQRNADEMYTVNFYPEGGHMVKGIKSKIAFQMLDNSGKGINLGGAILDQTNDTITTFKASKFGIGSFYFSPENGKTYKAILKLPNGELSIKQLPPVYSSGYVMHLATTDTKQLTINLQSNLTDEHIYLFAHHGQKIVFSSELILKKGQAEISIDEDQFPEGISVITLFNQQSKPVAERLFFHKVPASNPLNLTTDKLIYPERKEVNLEINSRESADLSLSVFRVDSLENIVSASIRDYILLTSELKGNIESPDYYFNHNDPQAIDNLMLTHGWRRFKWENVFENVVEPKFIPEYSGHIITGKVIPTNGGITTAGIKAYMSIPGKRHQLYVSQSNVNGEVKFHTRDFNSTNELIVQTNYQTDSLYRIDINSPFSTLYSNDNIPILKLDKNSLAHLNYRNINTQAMNVYGINKLHKYRQSQIDSISLFSDLSKKYKLDNYTRFPRMDEVLRENVYEVLTQKENKNYKLRVFDYANKAALNGSPLVLLDGVPIFNHNNIIAYDPLKVENIEVLDKRLMLGSENYGGLIKFITYNGNIAGYELDPRATVIDYEGMQLQREFYSPSYNTAAKFVNPLADFRDLLYWQSNVKTDTNGKANLKFYTSDQTGKYKVVIQGITSKGELLNKSAEFTVSGVLKDGNN